MAIQIESNNIKSIITIEGIKYSHDLFREWGAGGMEVGQLFRIYSRSDGCLAIERVEENNGSTEC